MTPVERGLGVRRVLLTWGGDEVAQSNLLKKRLHSFSGLVTNSRGPPC